MTVLGGMKGAAMKLGQVLSFVDLGIVPAEYRDRFQAKLAKLRDAAPTVRFEEMRRVIESDLDRADLGRLQRVRPRADRRGLDRPGLPGVAAATAATSRSRSSTRESTTRSAPT